MWESPFYVGIVGIVLEDSLLLIMQLAQSAIIVNMKYKLFPINKKIGFLIPSVLLFILSFTSIYFFYVNYLVTGILVLLAFGLPAICFLIVFLFLNSCFLQFDDSVIIYHHCFLKKDITFNVDNSFIVYIPNKQLISEGKTKLILNNEKESLIFKIDKDTISFLKELYPNNTKCYSKYLEAIKQPVRKNKASGLIIAGGAIEGFTINALIISLLTFLISPPPIIKTKVSDYQYIFDIVKDLDKVSSRHETKETIFNYGEYSYNSFLLLVPEETPSTLSSFYYRWQHGIDLDNLGFSFECKLEKDAFDNYVSGLDAFSITTGDDINKCLKIEDKFDYPVYIVQWLIPNEKWRVFEYIMIDYQNDTVIYVYSILDCFKYVKNNTNYNIAPNVDKSLVLENFGNVEDGFSIYMKSGTPTKYYDNPPSLSELSYDTSFLNYLL